MTGKAIAEQVGALRAQFNQGTTRPVEWRIAQLKALKRMLVEEEGLLGDAMKSDLGKSHFEGWSSETGFLINEIHHALKHVKDWMLTERVEAPLAFQPASCTIRKEPLGVVLVLGAWNYPVQLSLCPALAAITAGNCVLIKPSELSPACSAALAEVVPKYLDPKCIQVVEGGIPESTALLEQRWDHIFYTGGGRVAQVVMAAAAKHLTPVTLELGGKSPAIVDKKASLKVAARRIVRGKYWNTGQTCVAPDYALVHEEVLEPFLAAVKQTIRDFYGDDPKASPDLGRIVNERHFDRLVALLDQGTVVSGGNSDRESRYIEPTVVKDAPMDSSLMTDEIFGPILPVLPVKDIDEAIAFVNARPRPLALYLFTRSRKTEEVVLSRTCSGGVCVNDTLMHLAAPDLPFGGIGPSGMGAYHGRTGFETFTHRKSVMTRSTLVDPPLLYPPYTEGKKKVARILL